MSETPLAPVLIDFGKQSRKRVKALMNGEGPLMDDLQEALNELRSEGVVAAAVQTVVVVVERKPKRRGLADLLG